VTPADAAVAVRSYPRRYRAVLVRPDDEDGAEVVRRPGPDGWSALDHAAHAASSLDAAAEALRLVSIEEQPLVALAPERPERAGGVDEVLGRLAAAAERAAAVIERVQGKDWERRGRLHEDESVTALDLAKHAVHEGVHHLRAAERAVSTG
jgi:hypothetical protein